MIYRCNEIYYSEYSENYNGRGILNGIMGKKKIKIDLTYINPNSSFIYPLYSDSGEKIIDARIILTPKRIENIVGKFGNVVYYIINERRAIIPDYRMKQAREQARNILDEISTSDKLSKENLKQAEVIVEEIIRDLSSGEVETINLLKELKNFDEYLYNHSVNVGVLVAVFAKKLGQFKSDETKNMVLGAYLHDIGEQKLDKQLINKKGKLDISELKKMRRHPQLGYEILKKNKNIDPVVLQSVLFHHEKFNNRGYFQLPYENLPVYPKILSICDIFDALTSVRPFRSEPFNTSNAMKAILNSNHINFDYELVSTFINTMHPVLSSHENFYSINDIVELSTEELALVKGYNAHEFLKPKVLVFCKFIKDNGKIKASFFSDPFELDLAEQTERYMYRILNNTKQIRTISKMAEERHLL